MLAAMVVLVPLSQHARLRERLAGNVLGGLGLGIFALLIFQILLPFRSQSAAWEVPMLVVAGLAHPSLQWCYFAVLWAAILSSAVVSCYGVAIRLGGTFWPMVPSRDSRSSLSRFSFPGSSSLLWCV